LAALVKTNPPTLRGRPLSKGGKEVEQTRYAAFQSLRIKPDKSEFRNRLNNKNFKEKNNYEKQKQINEQSIVATVGVRNDGVDCDGYADDH
jgi:hypothetical protein